jgi:hypothetical protein
LIWADDVLMRDRQIAAVLTCALSVVLIGSHAAAQTTADSAVGKDVRVVYPNGTKRVGQLVSLTADEVQIRDNNGRVAHIGLEVVRRVETEHHAARLLTLLGGVLGSAAAFARDSCGEPNPVHGYVNNSPDACPSPTPLLAIGGGALAGAFIGSGIDDSQRRVLYGSRPKARPALSAVASNSGAALTISLRW